MNIAGVYDNLDSLPGEARGGVLTIGNFDGVHLGHQRILMQCRMLARQERLPVSVLTFDPPPDFVLRPAEAPPLLAPGLHNWSTLLRHGADHVVVIKPDQTFLDLPAKQFIEKVIVGRFAPRHVVEGQDFFFGRGRMGSISTLQAAQAASGFATHVVDSVTLMFRGGQRRVSSTLIRELVRDGDVEAAADCLGRKFELWGTVVAGEARGRLLGYPTINLEPQPQVQPGEGVYAGLARIGGDVFAAAISVGTNPTLHPDSRKRVVEAFLLDAEGDFYGKEVVIEFHRRLRDQQRFATERQLVEQIAGDVAVVREVLAKAEAN
jgi:riboflavin kinase/FMN adenylyltransferase